MNESNQPSWVGRTLGGRYQIVSRLGSGGMSTVYKAQDPNLQRAVAVKIIHPHLSENPEFVKRFEQEAAAVAQLRHPNIMQVHDFNHDGEVYYIIFEFIPGQPLDQKLKALKEASILMPLHDVILTMQPLCDAVAYAHGRKMIHRDLKPSNVIINLLNQPILLDFGIAKIVGGDYVHTATGATMGTAAYMPPEQVLGEEVDHRADIYSLGIILYEMAAGQPPYEGHSAITVMMKHVNEPLPDVRFHNSNLPASFTAVLDKSLAKKPADRFDSASEMALALRQVEQQLAAPSSTSQSFIGTAVRSSVAPTSVPQPTSVTAVAAVAPETITPPTTITSDPSLDTSSGIPPSASKKSSPWLLVGGAGLILLLLAAAAIYFVRQNGAVTAVPTSESMVPIPSGIYTVGSASDGSNGSSEQQLELAAYWLDRTEATNAAYAAFVATSEAEPPDSWNGATPPASLEAHPVQGLTWQMAVDYCQAQGKRLPTEAEWEVAARGDLGLPYPWGVSANAISLPTSGTYPVGSIPANRSPFGAYDMAGNVWEWVEQPYTAVPSGQQIARGGAYNFLKDLTYRLQGDPTVPTMFSTAGVRCAASQVRVVPDVDVLLQDDFTDETSGWPIVEEGSVLSGYHPPDYYHVQSGQPNHISTAYFGGNFTNIGLESDVFVDSTDTETGEFRYGLIVRRNGPQFYAFTVSPRTSRWAILKATPDGLQTLAEGDLSTLSNTAENPDRLRVDASGETFLFFVDGELISTLKDPSYAEGDVGFYVETFDEERAHIHYDRVQAERIERMPDTAVILEDDFTDPNSGWPEVEDGALLSGYHPPDFYHVQSGTPNHRSTAFFGGQLDNFTLETDVFVEATDTETGDFYYGIVVRQADETEYALLVSPRSGQWQVVKTKAADSEVLGSGADDSLVGESASDHLRIDADGDLLIFQVNGRPVLGVEDVPPSPRNIGFVVQTLDESRAHVHYDLLRVRDVDADSTVVPTLVSDASGKIEMTPEATIEVEDHTMPMPEPTVEPAPAEPTPTGPIPSSIGMVRVDAGEYIVGGDVVVTIPEFWIDRTEVSNVAYAFFVADTGQTPPQSWVDGTIPAGLDEHPVQGVTWDTAVAYCTWADKRLPTEVEWEITARGPHASIYPWGNEASTVKLPNDNTYPVGTIAQNRSYFGAFDMAGNVWEWVAEPLNTGGAGEQIIRGGAFNFPKTMAEFVAGDPENDLMFNNTGIRCAATAVKPEPDLTAVLADDFSNTLSGWYNARAPIGPFFYGYHPTDFYHVQVSAPQSCLTVYRDLPVENFTAEAQIFIAATEDETGDFRYGLIARENGNAFYAFTVSPRTQTWKLLKSTPDGLTLMDEGRTTTSSGIDQAHRDRLYVTGEGPLLTFFVNGELVSQITDPDYAQGNVGFMVETLDEAYAHIHFDSIEVRPLSASASAPANIAATVYPVDSPTCQGSVRTEDTLVQFTTHTVASGETLSNIATRYSVTQEEILAANGKSIDNPNIIREGQTIIIPQG